MTIILQTICVNTSNFSSRRRDAYAANAARVTRYGECLIACGGVQVNEIAAHTHSAI